MTSPATRLYVVAHPVPRVPELAVGSLGTVTLERGWYAYVGSALRAREARVARHLARQKPLRWHADYLFTAFPAERAWLVDGAAGECELAGALAALAGAERRPRRFGAGDCRCAGPPRASSAPAFAPRHRRGGARRRRPRAPLGPGLRRRPERLNPAVAAPFFLRSSSCCKSSTFPGSYLGIWVRIPSTSVYSSLKKP